MFMDMSQEETPGEKVLPEKLSQWRHEDLGQEAVSVKPWRLEVMRSCFRLSQTQFKL